MVFPASMFAALNSKVPQAAFGAGGRGNATPIFEAFVELPKLMIDPKSRINRAFTRFTKMALKKEMLFHHQRRIPDHFHRWRQAKYGYTQRSARVKEIKSRFNQPDLVETGRTKERMTREIQITHPRVGEGIGVRGILRWPVGFRFSGAAVEGVTPEVMADEISRWTLTEEKVAAVHVRDTLVDLLQQKLSTRAKRSIRGQLTGIGVKVT